MMDNVISDLIARVSALEAEIASCKKPRRPQPVRDIVRAVAAEYGVSAVDILGPSRERVVSIPRQEAMRRAYEDGLTLAEIGRALGRDHTTVMHGIAVARLRRVL